MTKKTGATNLVQRLFFFYYWQDGPPLGPDSAPVLVFDAPALDIPVA